MKFHPGNSFKTKKLIHMDLRPVALFLLLDAAVSFLFYRSVFAFIFLAPLYPLVKKEYSADMSLAKKQAVREQFLTGMQLFLSALQAGYAPENALREALRETAGIYPAESWIVQELSLVNARIGRNVSAEKVLLDMGQRSGDDDILSFCEVFYTSRRLGGDLLTITANTIEGIRQKSDTIKEIETELTGRILEQRIMAVIPLIILVYVSMTSPGFLDIMYHNLPGIIVMSVCLLLYLTAFFWSRSVIYHALETH